MKVLKNNYSYNKEEEIKNKEPYPRQFICGECESELEYEKSDVEIGAFGGAYLKCPLCGYNNFIDDEGLELALTADNVEFPAHFWHTSKETGAVERCNNKEIRNDIHRAIEYFRKNKKDYSWYTECGDTYVNVSRYDGDESYYVIVTNNYYSTYIPFEPEDY